MTPRPLVVCLCAGWCSACTAWRATFDALAARHAASADFAWIDIEDDSDALGDPDIENFPTLLVEAGDGLFLGPVLPQPAAAERLLQQAGAGGLAAGSAEARALAGRVRAVLAARGPRGAA